MKNSLIIIEGTDASGKTTQVSLLTQKLQKAGLVVNNLKFPAYDSPTGKIVGANYLGNPKYGESNFKEGAVNVNPKVAGLYFAADRLYNVPVINNFLSKGSLILDRYCESNMAHQAGKENDKATRKKIFKWFYNLEYKLLKLPKPDIRILLYMPREHAIILKQQRNEALDDHEKDENYLKNAELAYLELAKKMKFKIIHCVKDNQIRTLEDINQEVFEYVFNKLKKGK